MWRTRLTSLIARSPVDGAYRLLGALAAVPSSPWPLFIGSFRSFATRILALRAILEGRHDCWPSCRSKTRNANIIKVKMMRACCNL